MFKVKFYLYDETQENCKGKDLSEYVAIGSAITETLDGTIDTYALTLNGLPFRDEIEPSTKFIYEILDGDQIVKSIDMVLQSDAVEQPILSDDTYFIHSLELANPAILAQQKICDNMAFTYKLKDVDLTTRALMPDNNVPMSSNQMIVNYGDITLGDYDANFPYFVYGYKNYTSNSITYTDKMHYFYYGFQWVQPVYYNSDSGYGILYRETDISKFDISKIKEYILVEEESPSAFAEFYAPILRVSVGEYGKQTSKNIGYANTNIIITRTNDSTGKVQWWNNASRRWEDSEYKNLEKPYTEFNETFTTPYEHLSMASWFKGTATNIQKAKVSGTIMQASGTTDRSTAVSYDYTEIGVPQTYGQTITTERQMQVLGRYYYIGLSLGYHYNITCEPAFSVKYAFKKISKEWSSSGTSQTTYNDQREYYATPSSLYLKTSNFELYTTSTSYQSLTKSSTQPTCYDMLKKSVLTTYNAKRGTETNALDNDTFITLGNYERTLLKGTTIVENVMQEKNLWEVISAIGDYTHSKPYLVFDKDRKKGALSLKFKEYGSNISTSDLGTSESIYNSKFIEEYISSLDSYCDNLMQLNSTITEILYPSSESEDYLVYNDNVCLLTKYPIMEIVKLEVIDPSSSDYTESSFVDITDEVYEYNVWKCLGISTSTIPNRSEAIYYHLYSNKIEGMQYLIPTINKTAQYPIKKIIAKAFGMTAYDNIIVSDYAFRITYRTKDSVRVRNVRPDLRKYLYNNEYEYLPLHQQFRNQTDKIVDSEKLGNNIYGELIRTGNTIFEKVKWSDDVDNINKVGDFVKLQDGQMYYVSKVSTNVYTDHLESTIEYSKDFNRLSQIIGIPSEPRFYEISEQNNITRDVVINQTILVHTNEETIDSDNNVLHIEPSELYSLLTNENKWTRAKITYKDILKAFPLDDETTDSCTIYTPLLWSIQNTTLTFSCDMEDNFMVGNSLKDTNNAVLYAPSFFTMLDYLVNNSKKEQAYRTLSPVRYTDYYGRADYFDIQLGNIKLEGSNESVIEDIRNNLSNKNTFGTPKCYTTNDIVLNKDNREALSFNVCLSAITDSDRLLVSSMFWHMSEYYKDLKLVLFNDVEINKQSCFIESSDNFILYDNSCLKYDSETNKLYIDTTDVIASKNIKSFALCVKNETINKFIYFVGKNVYGDVENATKPIYIEAGRFEGRTNTTQLNKLLK